MYIFVAYTLSKLLCFSYTTEIPAGFRKDSDREKKIYACYFTVTRTVALRLL